MVQFPFNASSELIVKAIILTDLSLFTHCKVAWTTVYANVILLVLIYKIKVVIHDYFRILLIKWKITEILYDYYCRIISVNERKFVRDLCNIVVIDKDPYVALI